MEDETDRAPVTPPPRPMTHQSHRTVPCPFTPLGARSSIRKTRSPAFRVPTPQTPTTPIREALENVALRLTAQRLGVAPARDPLMPRKLNGNARIFGPSDAFPLLRYLVRINTPRLVLTHLVNLLFQHTGHHDSRHGDS